jgi:Zn-dependent protease
MNRFSYSIPAAPLDRARRLAATVPAWLWLTLIVAISVAVRTVIGRRSHAPWIFDDELIYARLAESLASSGSFAIRVPPLRRRG